MSYPPLPAAALGHWAGVREALRLDQLPEANALATQAVAVTGWDGYFMPTVICGVHFGICPWMPVEWTYLEWSTSYRWHRLILIHPDASEFVLWSTGLEEFLKGMHGQGVGLMRLDPLLTRMVLADISPLDVPE